MMLHAALSARRLPSNALCGLGMDVEGAGTHSFGISWEFFSTPDCFRYLMSMLEAGSLYPSHTRESIEAGNPGGFKFADFAPGGKYANVPVYDRLQYQQACYMGGGRLQQEDAAKQWQALVAQHPELATPTAPETFVPAEVLKTAAIPTPKAPTAQDAAKALETATGMPLTPAATGKITLPLIGEVSTTTLLIAAGAVVGLILITKGGGK